MKRTERRWAVLVLALMLGLTAQAKQAVTNDLDRIADGMVTALIDNFWGASFKDHPRRYFFNKMTHLADVMVNEGLNQQTITTTTLIKEI